MPFVICFVNDPPLSILTNLSKNKYLKSLILLSMLDIFFKKNEEVGLRALV